MAQKKTKPTTKKTGSKAAAKKVAPKKPAAKKAVVKKPAAKPVRKVATKPASAKKAPASKPKTPTRKAAATKKPAAKAFATPKKTPAKRTPAKTTAPVKRAPPRTPATIKTKSAEVVMAGTKKIAAAASSLPSRAQPVSGPTTLPTIRGGKQELRGAPPHLKVSHEPAIDYSAIVPGAADIDMRVFAPPKPLEVASGEAMSDDDLATLREMEATHEAVDRVRQNAKIKAPPPEFDGTHCVDCEDEEIEAGRLKLGYFTCIFCESEKERMAKLFVR